MSLQPAFHVRALWTGQRVGVDLVEESNGLQADGAHAVVDYRVVEQAQAANNVKVYFDNLLALPTTAWAILTRLHL